MAATFGRRVLEALKKLYLQDNPIGDAGFIAIADACCSSGMSSLTDLYVDEAEHPQLNAVCHTASYLGKRNENSFPKRANTLVPPHTVPLSIKQASEHAKTKI